MNKLAVVCGSGIRGFEDGASDTADFMFPIAVCLSREPDGLASRQLICADSMGHRFRCIGLSDGSVSTFAGSDQSGGFANGSCQAAAFRFPNSICADPLNPGCYWLGDESSIRYCDGKRVSLVAGCEWMGYTDGAGDQAQFRHVRGLLATSNRQTLYVAEGANYRLRSVDLKSHTLQVQTICGDGTCRARDGVGLDSSLDFVHRICFDRSSNVKPESVMFITTGTAVRRFDIETGNCVGLFGICCLLHVACRMSHVAVHNCNFVGGVFYWSGALTTPFPHLKLRSFGLASTTNYLIVSTHNLKGLYAIHIKSGDTTQISTEFDNPPGLALDGDDCTLFVADDKHSQIKLFDLPERYF